MAKTFRVEIVTPEATAFSADVTSLQVPAWEGYLGVLAGHAPLLAVLKSGVATVKDEAGRETFFAIRGGFMEVGPGRTIILADAIEPAKGIDPAAAAKALDAIQGAPPEPPASADVKAADRARLRQLAIEEREQERHWAEARVKAAERSREAT